MTTSDLWQIFVVGVVVGAGMFSTIALPYMLKLYRQHKRDVWWREFWARHNERNRRTRH